MCVSSVVCFAKSVPGTSAGCLPGFILRLCKKWTGRMFFPPLRETQAQLNVAKIARQEIQYISQFGVIFHRSRTAGRQPLATCQVLRKHPLLCYNHQHQLIGISQTCSVSFVTCHRSFTLLGWQNFFCLEPPPPSAGHCGDAVMRNATLGPISNWWCDGSTPPMLLS